MKIIAQLIKYVLFGIAFIIVAVISIIGPAASWAFSSLILSALINGEKPTFASFLLRVDAITGWFLLLMPVGFLIMMLPSILGEEKINSLINKMPILKWLGILLEVIASFVGMWISFSILAPILFEKTASLESFFATFLSYYRFSTQEILSNGLLASSAYRRMNFLLNQYGISKLQAKIISVMGIILSLSNIIANIEGNLGFFERITGKKIK